MTINYTYTITTSNVASGTPIYWRVVSRTAGGGGTTGVVANDFDTSSGNFTSNGTRTEVVSVGVKEQTGTEGTRNFTLQVSLSSGFSPRQEFDFQVVDGNTVANAPTVTPSTTTPTEGDTVTFTFGEAAGSAAQTYYFDITHGTTSNADFTADPPGNGATARTTVTWNGTSFSPTSVAVTLAGAGGADGVDDNETFTGKLFDAVTGGTEVATTATITVADDPAAASFDIPSNIIAQSAINDVARATANFNPNGDFDILSGNTIAASQGTSGPINTGGSIADMWVEDAEHAVGFGDDYQIKAVAYNSGGAGLNDFLVSGKSGGGAKSWINDTGSQTDAQLWHRLDQGFTIAVGGNTSGDILRQIDFEIKEYSGTLGTGTTVLTQSINMEALHPN